MHNPIVTTISRALVDRGLSVLRFNFRGAGNSKGQHDQGRSEQADLSGALTWLLTQPQVDPYRVSLVGYSFGAWIAALCAQADARVAAVALVGLPSWYFDASLSTQDSRQVPFGLQDWQVDPRLLHRFSRPKLLISGQNDPFCPPAALERFVEHLPSPKSLHLLGQTDHFFAGQHGYVGQLIADYMTKTMFGQP